MQISEILDHIKGADEIDADTLRRAAICKNELAPRLMEFIADFLDRPSDADRKAVDRAVFWSFYMLGEYRWRPAYGLMASLLAIPSDRLEAALGEMVLILAPRVMANVFDGDPAPLYAIIEDEWADGTLRECLIDTLVMAVRRGTLGREAFRTWLAHAFSRLQPQGPHSVWFGWEKAIGILGFADLVPFVKKANECGFVVSAYISFDEFLNGMRTAEETATSPWWIDADAYLEFGVAVDEIESWHEQVEDHLEGLLVEEVETLARREEASRSFLADHLNQATAAGRQLAEGLARAQEGRFSSPDLSDAEGHRDPASNPDRRIGRNGPCPCGSGRKFKNCCLH